MRGVTPPLPNTPSWRGAQLKKKHGDNFACTFIMRAMCTTHLILLYILTQTTLDEV
jgi:hypothetical protein